jgi:peptide/nickel transport system substrate-binding protein
LTLAVVGVLAAVLAGCQDDTPTRGGTLDVLTQGDPGLVDPGQAYDGTSYEIAFATQRPLYSYRPGDPSRAVPDLAAARPLISRDGKTVRVQIRPDVRFSPPVNREVVAGDVKYAIERGYQPSVQNQYVDTYFGDLVGLSAFRAHKSRSIPGIETPDARTIVFHLKAPSGPLLAGALALPLSAPVPPEYARKFDRRNPSTYAKHEVATGPYMMAADSTGTVTGYTSGKRITLVRNPNWSRKTDPRPAKLDRIVVRPGFDPSVGTKAILAGHARVNGDFAPPPAQLAAARQRGELRLVSLGGISYVGLNTRIAPFDNVNVRRAVLAGFDRTASRLVRGGSLRGEFATHFLPPQTPGFAEAGGGNGFGFDFLRDPHGNLELARRYLRQAGYAGGRYRGPAITMIGASGGTPQRAAEVAQEQLQRLGFHVDLRLLSVDASFSRCSSPKNDAAVCSGGSWFKDFNDPETMLRPLFGRGTAAAIGPNWSRFETPAIDRAIERASSTVEPAARASAWARVDRLTTSQAPAIPLLWDWFPYVWSEDVHPVVNEAHAGFDFTYTSLK